MSFIHISLEKEGNKRYDTAYIMIQKRFLLRLCAESIIWTVKKRKLSTNL